MNLSQLVAKLIDLEVEEGESNVFLVAPDGALLDVAEVAVAGSDIDHRVELIPEGVE